jgi:hypothetical protein
MLIEVCFYGKLISHRALVSVGVLMLGVLLASITDPQVGCSVA